MNKMDDDGVMTLRVKRVTVDGEPTHWDIEGEIVRDGESSGTFGCTSPTFYSGVDAFFEYLHEELKDEEDNQWLMFNANLKKSNNPVIDVQEE
jgi:hypothetical protein